MTDLAGRGHARVQVYHPSPNDLWRWTHAGACIGMLLTHFIELLAGRVRLRTATPPLVAP